MSLAVYFPDSEAFYPGMGIELYESCPEVRNTFKKSGIFAGYNLKKIVYGEGKDLSERQRKIAVMITSISIFREWQKTSEIAPDCLCGKGIGYISAQVCAGRFPLWYAVWKIRTGKKIPSIFKEGDKVFCLEEGNQDLLRNCNIVVDIGPSRTYQTNRTQSIAEEGKQCKVYFDHPEDSSFLFDMIKRNKVMNFFYAGKRLSGIAVSTKNHSNDSAENHSLDNIYMDLINAVSNAEMRSSQKGSHFTEEEFCFCVDLLIKILQIKKVNYEEVSGQFAELQKETGINIDQYFKGRI